MDVVQMRGGLLGRSLDVGWSNGRSIDVGLT